jgi:hypothetical protein
MKKILGASRSGSSFDLLDMDRFEERACGQRPVRPIGWSLLGELAIVRRMSCLNYSAGAPKLQRCRLT